jgi:hydroxymethylbilane synthase
MLSQIKGSSAERAGGRMGQKVRIGTRGSKLALWQANWVKERIEQQSSRMEVEIVKIKTTGDKILDVALAKVGGKGLFVKEIEEALLDQGIDVAVHSMKDVPTKLADSLHIAAITEREDPRDVLISNRWRNFNELPPGSRIGTSSLRRQAQILHVRPDLKMMILRGNLDTRLRKLREEGLDAIIVAASGVIRLGEQQQITQYLEPDFCLPATGQGTLALECRKEDPEINGMLRPLNASEVSLAVRAERAFLERLGGGCQVPIAAYGEIDNGTLLLKGLIASVDGKRLVSDKISGDSNNPEAMGRELAERLLGSGGQTILREIYGVLSQE